MFEADEEICEHIGKSSIIRQSWKSGPMKGLARISVSSEMNLKQLLPVEI